jgi:TolB protein
MQALLRYATLLVICFIATAIQAQDTIHFAGEKHFKNVQQLTFGGDNAECYFGFDNSTVVFQRTNKKEGLECDQIFWGSIPKKATDKFKYKLVSTGKGRTTCSYLMPDKKHVLYASTHKGSHACPPVPDRNKWKKYVWPIYPEFDIFVADQKGNIDGSNVKQITNELGYDGGAWFSADGKQIVWRASRPKTEQDIKDYKDLLDSGLVMPTNMEVYVANSDGSNVRQVTKLGQANWAPNFTPDGKRIIFASNHEHKRGFPFNLYLINIDGTGLERISTDGGFDAFPAFSPDGKKFVFCSNRNNKGTRDTNVFVCDWVE